MTRKLAVVCLALAFWVATAGFAQPAETPTPIKVESGEIEGALYQLAVPADWKGKLLLHAHGYRLETEPLRADLDLEDGAYRHYLSQGWIVGLTSYRRNGLIVGDGVRDLENLWDHVAATHGKPETTIVEGFSMGGVIVTLIAEAQQERFDGAVGAGAALGHPQLAASLTHAPRIPLLLLTNRSEITGPRNYVTRASDSKLPPVLWEVRRDGHVNVSHTERRAAIDAVIRWIANGEVDRDHDPTHEVTAESTATIDGGRAAGTVQRITTDYGNVFSSFVPADVKRLGVDIGDTFAIKTNAGTFTFTYGTTFSDVPRGQPVAFATAEGEIVLAINYGNAAKTLGISEGDPLILVKK